MTRFHDSAKRSAAKAFTWGLCGGLMTAAITYALTGDTSKSVEAFGSMLLVKPFAHYWHDRVWNLVRWGRHAS